MNDKVPPPFTGDVRAFLTQDGKNSIINIGTSEGDLKFSIPSDMIIMLIEKLRLVMSHAEKRRRATDPFAGRDGDIMRQTAIMPNSYGVGAMVADTHKGVGLMFHLNDAPQTFFLTPEEAEDVARRLIDAARGEGPQPPSKN